MPLTTGFAFLAGVITVLSPCVLPLLPVILATAAQEGKARPIGVVIGFVACFTFATLALSYLVRSLGLPPDINRLVAGYVLILLGLVLAVPFLHDLFERSASLLVGRFRAAEPRPKAMASVADLRSVPASVLRGAPASARSWLRSSRWRSTSRSTARPS
uniref:cytochrome c biogenesis CcdA family protein n=1 Tax=Neorhizobium sp. EC2-8 TaxID=3129230 RepID=UPI003101B1A0